MRELRMKGQSRIHMKQESDQRKREILSSLRAIADWDALILQSKKSGRITMDTRQKLILLMAQHKSWQSVAELVVEDSTDSARDRKTFTWLLQNGTHQFKYSFKKPSEDPGLWAADAVVWAFAKGGIWRNSVIEHIRSIEAPD